MASRILRATDADETAVTNMELFFDLVYVFAITQLSDFLFKYLTARGALEGLILFAAVWWAWNLTAWATNWIDPDKPLAALAMVVLMALSLFMAAALPKAFGPRGADFAIAYVALQLGRTGFVAWAFPSGDPMRANNLRLAVWLATGGAVWIVGAYLTGDARLVTWGVAVVIEWASPLHNFQLPGHGGLPIENWRLSGSHLAERYQLVLMIALGESVLRVGATAAEQTGSISTDIAWIIGFLASVALWAVYFLRLAEEGATRVATATEGRAARVGRGYAYAHAAMVAGVIVVAVAIRLTIDAPEELVTVPVTLVILGGPTLYLLGLAAYERSARIASPVRLLVVIWVLAVLIVPAVAGADRLVLSICATIVLLVLGAVSAVKGAPEDAAVP